MSVYSMDNAVFTAFAFYATASIIKMLCMSFLTAKNRFAKKAFANPEDISPEARERLKPVLNDPDVERVRRNHLNDIENIVPFVLLGFLYVAIDPSTQIALNHFRFFFFSRLFHTIAYQVPLPQPSRALGFMVGMVVNMSMAVQVLMGTW